MIRYAFSFIQYGSMLIFIPINFTITSANQFIIAFIKVAIKIWMFFYMLLYCGPVTFVEYRYIRYHFLQNIRKYFHISAYFSSHMFIFQTFHMPPKYPLCICATKFLSKFQ
uniref:Uncharacterized protein n=1 Tax=Panstrongylus lignarius TaxID=156445 RepID=A0A224XXG1_9HEMI